MKYKIKVGKAFYDDHASRGLVMGEYEQERGIVKETKTHYLLELTEEDALDLISDGYHYSDCHEWIGSDWFGMAMSARSAVKATAKAMREQGYQFSDEQRSAFGFWRLGL